MILIVVLFLLAILLLQTNYAQNKISNLVLNKFSKNYNATWSINNIHVNFFDEITAEKILFLDQKNDTLLASDKLHIDIGFFSLFDKKIIIDDITFQGLKSHIYTDGSDDVYNFDFLLSSNEVTEDSESQGDPWQINIRKVNLTNLAFSYNNNSIDFALRQEKFTLISDELDIENKNLSFSSIALENGEIVFVNKDTEEDPKESFSYIPDLGINIHLDKINLSNQLADYKDNNFIYDNIKLSLNTENVTLKDSSLIAYINALDFHHPDILKNAHIDGTLEIKNKNIQLDQLNFTSEKNKIIAEKISYNGKLDNEIEASKLDLYLTGSFIDDFKELLPSSINPISGTPITANAKSIKYGSEAIQATNLKLHYGDVVQSHLELEVKISGNNSATSISSSLENLELNIDELSKVFPNLTIPEILQGYKNTMLQGEISGDLKQLFLKNTYLKIDDQLETKFSGSLHNLENTDNLRYNLQLEYINTDIHFFDLDSIDIVDLESLGKLNYKGDLTGDLQGIDTDGTLATDIGKAILDLMIDFPSSDSILGYKGDINLIEVDMATFLKRDDIGTLTLNSTVDGKGIALDELDANIVAYIDHVEYNGYDYQDAIINGRIRDRIIISDLRIEDVNINLSYNGTVDLKTDLYVIDIETEIDTIAPQILGLMDEDLRFSGNAKIKMDLPLQNGETASLFLDNIYVSKEGKHIHEDSVQIELQKSIDTTYLSATSNFLDINAQGIYKIEDLWKGFQQTINHYYPITEIEGSEKTTGFVKGKAVLKNSEVINFFVQKKYFYTKGATLNFDTDFPTNNIDANLLVDSLVIDNHHADSLYTSIRKSDNKLVVQTNATATYLADKFLIQNLQFTNELTDNLVRSTLITGDENLSEPELFLSTLLSKEDKDIQLVLQDNLIFNDTNWEVNGENNISYIDGKILVDQLEISDSKQAIAINSKDTTGNDYKIDFTNFDVNSIVQLLYSDTVQLSGVINGYIDIKDARNNLFYLVQLDMNDIVYENTPVGDIEIRATENPLDGFINSTITATGRNNLVGRGTYDPSVEYLELEIDIETIEARLLDLFLYGTIANTDGKLSGDLVLRGHKDHLKIDGNIKTESLESTIVSNNTRYNFGNHEVSFNENIIDIGELIIRDKEDNSANIVGLIYHEFFDNFVLDLSIKTDKFLFLNSTRKENPVLFGDVYLEADVNILGPLELMKVDAIAETKENTSITLSPFSETESLLQDDYISFGKPEDFEIKNLDNLVNSARKYPFDVNLLLDATNAGSMTIIVDPISGDKLETKGNGNLRTKFKPDGSQEIFGLYNVESGTYSFSYGDFVAKNFTIKEGSTVKFVGDPLNAELDITAIYSVYTSTYELIKNEVILDENEISASKKRTNIEVSLRLSGKILSPEISLDITTAEDNTGQILAAVERKLADLRNNPNELNNQVFGLIIFNSFFMSSNSTNSLGGVGAGIALNSLSSLISNELNSLAKNAIKGVEINVDFNNYNSQYLNEGQGGNVTELGLSVSKQLFNDRLSVQAGGNLNLESDNSESNYSSLVGDFILEYKLTENGNYRVRVFSKGDYDRLLNENSNKNGVGLIFRKSFDSKIGKKNNE
jgi:hypothetical protein